MLNVPDAPVFVPYIMALVVGGGFLIVQAVLVFLRARQRGDRDFLEFRIVSLFSLLALGAFAIIFDATVYETQHGDAQRLSVEIERVYGIDVDTVEAQLLWDGMPAEVDGVTYRLSGDHLEKVEGWSDVPVP